MAGDELARRGWHLTADGIDACTENGNHSVEAIIKNALNTDLRDIGEKWLPEELTSGRGKLDYLEGPAVLQVLKLRNISAPKDNEESQTAPKLWKMTLTDGQSSCLAIALEPIKNMSLVTPPGTKLVLEGTVDVESTYLLLSNKNVRLLGGRVANMVDSWELKRKLAQQSRAGIQSEGGPPPFVPFGKKIAVVEAPRKDNFKSLAAGKQAEEEENSEFQQQRLATIAEALTAKTKTFGTGPKQAVQDRDIARIVEMGFSTNQANAALRQAGGDVNIAINGLISGGYGDAFMDGSGRGRGGTGGRDRNEPWDRQDRGSRQGGRGGRGGGPGRRGRERDEEEEAMSSRPSGPATLFDFLETKIPSKQEKHQGGSTNNNYNRSTTTQNQKPKSSVQNQKPNSSSSWEEQNHRPQSAAVDDATFSRSHQSGAMEAKPISRGEGTNYNRSNDSDYRSQTSDSSINNKSSSDVRSSASTRSSSDIRSGGRDYRDARSTTATDGGGGGGGGSYSDESQVHGRRQPNLPPRLANKLGRENNVQQGSSRPYGGRYQENHSDSSSRRTRLNDDDIQKSSQPNKDHSTSSQNSRVTLQEQNSEPPKINNAVEENVRQQSQGEYPQNRAGQKPRYDNRKQPNPGSRLGVPSRPMLQRGQTVLAKYWEDEQLYPAVIEAVADNGATVVVTFIEYGNQEEVLTSDVHPLAPQNWHNGYPPAQSSSFMAQPPPGFYAGFVPPGMGPVPPPFPGQDAFNSSTISSMEFRRGGSGPSYRRQDQTDKRRPTQSYYTPPTRKRDD